MRNIKFISSFAVCGFILSFVFGLFSHSSFFAILLKAFIFSLGFGCLGFLISFVFDKFLSDSDGDSFNSGDFTESSVKPSGDVHKSGQLVDIVVEDEELPESDSNNHFVVGDNHQMLKKGDIKEDNSEITGDVENKDSFVPIRKNESAKNFSGTEAVAPEDIKSSSSSENSDTSVYSDEDLDTLPDMENLDLSGGNEEGEEDIGSFSSSNLSSSENVVKKSDVSTPDVKDAALIAKAISTALAEEDSL